MHARSTRSLALAFAALACLAVGVAQAADAPDGAQPPGGGTGTIEERARKIGPDLYQLGAVIINAKDRTVSCPGKVNMDKGGPVEVLACLPTGKVHESVLTLDVDPLDVQIALLLLGLEPGRNPGVQVLADEAQAAPPPGDMVEITVTWEEPAAAGEGTRTVRHRADELLHDIAEDKGAPETAWVFTGSYWMGEQFGATIEGSLVTTYYDRSAILELPTEKVNDDTWCEVNEAICPPAGTPVTLVVRALPPKQDEDAPAPGP